MKPWKILVVDDEPMVLSVHRAYLERMGHEVVTCEEGDSALMVYQKHQGKFDLLITDYRMPKLNGIQLTQMLRLFDAAMPVVMTTGYCEEISSIDLQVHRISCLAKPFRYGDMYAQLKSLQQVPAAV